MTDIHPLCEVSQEDREAALSICGIYAPPYHAIESGKADESEFVQAFARHRQATRAQVLEEAASVVDRHRPDASFDDSQAGAMERNALLDNVAAEIRLSYRGDR